MTNNRLGLKDGDRIRLVGKHPWAGYAGTVVREMNTPIGWAPVVMLDGRDGLYDQEACVFSPKDFVREGQS